jgi:hypothetical protein
VHNNVDDKPMVGFYRGGTLRSVLRLNTDNDFRLLSSDLSTPANLTAGNLTVSGTGTSSFGGPLTVSPGAIGGGYLNLNKDGADLYLETQRWTGVGSNFGATRITGSTSGGGFLTFSTSNETTIGAQTFTERMRLTSGGNVLIGTTTDGGQKLQVSGTANIGNPFSTSTDDSLILHGKAVSDGSGNYGDYGSIVLYSSSSFTASARRYLITNAYLATDFAIIRSTNATTTPTIGTNGVVSSGTVDFRISESGNATFAGSVKAASEVYAEKTGAGIAGQSTGSITQFTTVNSTTYNVTTGSAKVFVVQLASGDAALCYTSYKSSTITILGTDGTIVNSSSPSSTQLGIYKSANDHVISFKTGSNAAAGGYGSWGFCFLGNPIISIA